MVRCIRCGRENHTASWLYLRTNGSVSHVKPILGDALLVRENRNYQYHVSYDDGHYMALCEDCQMKPPTGITKSNEPQKTRFDVISEIIKGEEKPGTTDEKPKRKYVRKKVTKQ